VNALAARQRGEKVFIEHVAPLRALGRLVIGKIKEGAPDEKLAEFVRENFKLALLTAEETRELNRQNRSTINPDRLKKAGIALIRADEMPAP
jgi:hypothetical protein